MSVETVPICCSTGQTYTLKSGIPPISQGDPVADPAEFQMPHRSGWTRRNSGCQGFRWRWFRARAWARDASQNVGSSRLGSLPPVPRTRGRSWTNRACWSWSRRIHRAPGGRGGRVEPGSEGPWAPWRWTGTRKPRRWAPRNRTGRPHWQALPSYAPLPPAPPGSGSQSRCSGIFGALWSPYDSQARSTDKGQQGGNGFCVPPALPLNLIAAVRAVFLASKEVLLI